MRVRPEPTRVKQLSGAPLYGRILALPGEECGVLEGVEVLEPVSGGDARACGGAGGATGGAVFAPTFYLLLS